jgi:hypothetical protein
MRKNEFDGISEADMDAFQVLVERFYEKPWEEVYPLLTDEIENRLRRRDTNKNYRPSLTAELDYLVVSVVARLIKINAKLRRAGKEILDFPAMLESRVGHVYHEELRRLSRAARHLDIDNLDLADRTAPVDRALEETEEASLTVECYKRCLGELPPGILDIFLEYYDVEGLTPSERAEARRRLALKVEGAPPDEATPEKVRAAKDKLDIMLSKWRRRKLTPCKDECLKRGL